MQNNVQIKWLVGPAIFEDLLSKSCRYLEPQYLNLIKLQYHLILYFSIQRTSIA